MKGFHKPLKAGARACILVIPIFLLIVMIFPSFSYAQDPKWTKVSDIGPTARSYATMDYDSRRGVMVLFGGQPGGDETWEWDGNSWKQILIDGPPSRYGHVMCYDSLRGVMVLYGGYNAALFQERGDTWEYDGKKWTEKNIEGPPARYFSAMAYDRKRGVMVLYGARLVTHAGTWEYDGATWQKRRDTGPGNGLSQNSLAYDQGAGRTVLFGGVDGNVDPFGETWIWNGKDWFKASSSGPEGRYHASFVYDANWDKIFLYGGTRNTSTHAFGDSWILDGNAWKQLNIPGPEARYGQAIAYDSRKKQLVMFSGFQTGRGPFSDTWIFKSGYSPPGGADLAIQSISKPTGKAGETLPIEVVIANNGIEDAKNFLLQLKEGEHVIGDQRMGILKAGEKTKAEFSYTPLTKGRKKLSTYVDPLGDVVDINRTNNTANVTLTIKKVKGVDLIISHVRVRNAATVTSSGNTPVNIQFRVTNVGSKPSATFVFEAYLTAKENKIRKKDTVIVVETVKALKPGQTIDFDKTVLIKKLKKKMYFQGFVDTENAVKESNEENNTNRMKILKSDL